MIGQTWMMKDEDLDRRRQSHFPWSDGMFFNGTGVEYQTNGTLSVLLSGKFVPVNY